MSCQLWDNVENMVEPDKQQKWQFNMEHYLCMPDNLKLEAHTQNM
jgi:hypothetical protein